MTYTAMLQTVFALALIGALGALAAFALPAAAHVHPIVPADECASSDRAGNVAEPQNGDNGQDFIPGFIPVDNPGNANLGNAGAGVGPATAHCAGA